MRWLLLAALVGCGASASRLHRVKLGEFEPAQPPAQSDVDRVADGRLFFMRSWQAGDPLLRSGAPNPERNDTSCVACHSSGGVGGAGTNEHNVQLKPSLMPTVLGTRGFGGGVVPLDMDTAITAVLGSDATRPDDTRFEERDAPVAVMRNTPALFGAGAIDAIPQRVLTALAEVSHPDHPEVTGVVSSPIDGPVGRFGWKGQTASLDRFVRDACRVEVGLRTVIDNPESPDLDPVQFGSMAQFVHSLPPPPMPVLSAEQQRGFDVFDDVGCTTCHAPNVGEVQGIFSDLLLHDMGEDLDDPEFSGFLGYGGSGSGSGLPTALVIRGEEAVPQRMARRSEWRTPPLWGVADSAPYLHDGRAQTLADAISRHGGEALRIRQAFNRLASTDQDAVVSFLGALRSPVMAAAEREECVDADGVADAG